MYTAKKALIAYELYGSHLLVTVAPFLQSDKLTVIVEASSNILFNTFLSRILISAVLTIFLLLICICSFVVNSQSKFSTLVFYFLFSPSINCINTCLVIQLLMLFNDVSVCLYVWISICVCTRNETSVNKVSQQIGHI